MNIDILFFFFNITSHNKLIADIASIFSDYIAYALPVLIVVYFYFFENKSIRKIFFVTCSTVGAYIVSDLILKNIFAIPRPFIALGYHPLVSETSFSFPSGHATMAGALFFSTLLALPNRKWVVGVVGLVCVGIAVSRVMLGVHYPTDIFAGWCVGMLFAYVLHKVFPYFQDLAK